MREKTVAIIGAGPSGLVTAKEATCCGLNPTVFEKGSSIGGQWKSDGGGVWESMQINNSRYASSFSDYEWKGGSEDFPNQKEVYRYLFAYANHFDIHKNVRLHSIVIKIEEANDKWYVEWIDEHKQVKSAIFDFVIVCSGIFSKTFSPEIPGLETFTGSITHARDYKNPIAFKGKTVAIVGNAFSGCEIAVEVASKAKKVLHIFNEAKWVMSRYLEEEESKRILPFDLVLYNRSAIESARGLSSAELNEKSYKRCCNLCEKQEGISLEWTVNASPSDPPFVAISDFYLSKIKEKTITPVKSSIKQIERDTLYLSNNEAIKVDALIFCTGYRAELPFFSASMKESLGFKQEDPLCSFFLYKTVFHPKFLNMAFVGMGRFSIFFGPIELQARWACMTLSGRIPFKTKKEMEKAIAAEKEAYYKNAKSQFSQGYVGFCDDLASQIGVLPSFTKLQEEDGVLYEKLWNGPFTTASFRLEGFGSNREFALRKVDELMERVGKPFLNPKCLYKEDKISS